MTTVAIIGAGPAGLAIAYGLVERGFQVRIFDADDEPGGLARSFQLGNVRLERYYHFLCEDDDEYRRWLHRLGLFDRMVFKPTKMGFFFHGKLYPFSSGFDLLRFSPMTRSARVRYGLHVLYCSLLSDWKRLDGVAATDWLTEALGVQGYKATWYPLLNVKFHEHHETISAAWVWHRVHRVAKSRKTPLHREKLGYIRGGTEQLVKALCEGISSRGGEFFQSTRIAQILFKEGRAAGVVTADGAEYPTDLVVSAVPLPVFLRMGAKGLPDSYKRGLASIPFLAVACVVMHLRKRVSENFWLNVNDPRIPFNGLIEYSNLNSEVSGLNGSVVYMPFYVPTNHPAYTKSDKELIEDCIYSLSIINPEFSRSWIRDAAVGRDPYAQVVCSTGFSLRVPEHQTPVPGLYLAESSQLYPSDRTISGTLELASRVSALVTRNHGHGA